MVYGHSHHDLDATFSVAVNVCENCGASCETLHEVPEFDYMGCDECMLEALAVLRREQVEADEIRRRNEMEDAA